MTMITPSYLGETIEYSSLHACRSTLEDPTAAQTEALVHLQEGETQLVRLQERLQQNLETLADAGTFQQAVHSLTAAIHLMTSQVGTQRRPGAAA